MKKLSIFILALTFLSSLASAHVYYYEGIEFDNDYHVKEKITETKYYPRDDKTVTTTTYIDYDNEERYPTYDYRWGYTYRSTPKYRDEHYQKKIVRRYYEDHYDDYYYNYHHSPKRDYYEDHYSGYYPRDYYHSDYYKRPQKSYYYKYIPHLREYQKVECYTSAPKGTLFYRKCP